MGVMMVFGVFSAEAASSLGDPFDGNALKNPNWQWKTSDEAGVEPKDWGYGQNESRMAACHR